MPREDFACTHRLRVRWAEVDMQKIVFNAHYDDQLEVLCRTAKLAPAQ